jgi:hypothetical protein
MFFTEEHPMEFLSSRRYGLPTWTSTSKVFASEAIAVLHRTRRFRPLSDRDIHYYVGDGAFYKAACKNRLLSNIGIRKVGLEGHEALSYEEANPRLYWRPGRHVERSLKFLERLGVKNLHLLFEADALFPSGKSAERAFRHAYPTLFKVLPGRCRAVTIGLEFPWIFLQHICPNELKTNAAILAAEDSVDRIVSQHSNEKGHRVGGKGSIDDGGSVVAHLRKFEDQSVKKE